MPIPNEKIEAFVEEEWKEFNDGLTATSRRDFQSSIRRSIRLGLELARGAGPEKEEIISTAYGFPKNSGMHSENARRKGWNEYQTAKNSAIDDLLKLVKD